jgi:hypothetical protein
MRTTAGIALGLSLFTTPAFAGYDFTLKPITVDVVTADGKPLPCIPVVMGLSVSEFAGDAWCGILNDGICGQWGERGIFKGLPATRTVDWVKTDANGKVTIDHHGRYQYVLPTRKDPYFYLSVLLDDGSCDTENDSAGIPGLQLGYEMWGSPQVRKLMKAMPEKLHCSTQDTFAEYMEAHPFMCEAIR